MQRPMRRRSRHDHPPCIDVVANVREKRCRTSQRKRRHAKQCRGSRLKNDVGMHTKRDCFSFVIVQHRRMTRANAVEMLTGT